MLEFKFKNLLELLDYFKDEEICKKFLEEQRWGTNIVCPHCRNGGKIYRTGSSYKCGDNTCYKKFSVTKGTIFEHSRIPLKVWFASVYLSTAHKKGISSVQLAKDLGITQKTAWFVLHRLREGMRVKNPVLLEGVIEADETYYGGKVKNSGKNNKVKNQGRSTETKTPIFGLAQRDGDIIVKPVVDTKGKTLKPIINSNVKQGSTICTDEWKSYNGLSNNFTHLKVEHGLGKYVKGLAHTNSLEGFWSHFKRGINAIQIHVSNQHLHRYCNEYAFRYNTRNLTDVQRFGLSLQNFNGRLSYKTLIGKENEKKD